MKPSSKMLKAMRLIQNDLNIKFEGDRDDFTQVKEFLDEHMETWRERIDNAAPSENQLKGVKLIEEKLGITYTGENTRKEVSEFLDSYLSKAFSKTSGKKKSSDKEDDDYVEPPDPFDN